MVRDLDSVIQSWIR